MGTWNEFLSSEENRAGLLQFGLRMLSGNSGSFAQDFSGAVGEGFEARDRVVQDERNTATAAAEGGRAERLLKTKESNATANQTRAKAALVRAAKTTGKEKGYDSGMMTKWLTHVKEGQDVIEGQPVPTIEDLVASWKAKTGQPAPPGVGTTRPQSAPVSTTPTATAPVIQEGQTATHPATGQKMMYTNGQWVAVNG